MLLAKGPIQEPPRTIHKAVASYGFALHMERAHREI